MGDVPDADRTVVATGGKVSLCTRIDRGYVDAEDGALVAKETVVESSFSFLVGVGECGGPD